MGVLRYYLTVGRVNEKLSGSEAIFLTFVKEDLAEVIVDSFSAQFEQRKQRVCRFIVGDVNPVSASRMLLAAALHGVFNAETTLTFIIYGCIPII